MKNVRNWWYRKRARRWRTGPNRASSGLCTCRRRTDRRFWRRGTLLSGTNRTPHRLPPTPTTMSTTSPPPSLWSIPSDSTPKLKYLSFSFFSSFSNKSSDFSYLGWFFFFFSQLRNCLDVVITESDQIWRLFVLKRDERVILCLWLCVFVCVAFVNHRHETLFNSSTFFSLWFLSSFLHFMLLNVGLPFFLFSLGVHFSSFQCPNFCFVLRLCPWSLKFGCMMSLTHFGNCVFGIVFWWGEVE